MADRRRRDLLALTLVAVVLRLPAILSPRHLSFDDGVYGATAVAMRHGARPYRDVFSSQGPLHHVLIFLADLVGLRTSVAPRLLSLAAGVAITLCTYLAARAVADRRAGLVAAGLATTAGSILLVTTGISGDGPAIAFAIGAVAVALAARDHDGWGRPVAAGLLVGAACSVKLLVGPVVLVVGLLLLVRGRPRQLVAAAVAAVAVPLVLAAPWGYSRVWDQSFTYHREARRSTVPEAAWRIVTTLFERDLFVTLTALVVVAVALLARASWKPSDRPVLTRPGTVFGIWLVAQVGFLLVESAMWRPHVSQLVVPLCLLAALRLPSWRVLAVAWVVAFPVWAVSVAGLVRPGGYRGADAAVSARLRALPDSAVVVTDEPGFAWRAGRRVPDALVDVSVKQLDQGRITEADVLAAARARAACAVLITADERMGRFDDLPGRLDDAGYQTVLRDGDLRLLVRGCP
ncbi:MAG: glycosyltransferase family 39 protein [Acidimicrobiia bacterium]|jgi:4-amino-4-deoxy-L-arabinose transferase-like glycosyltransferase